MRIISSFHDYYDTAMSEGQDQTRVFVRKTEDISVSASNRKFDYKKAPALYEFMTERLGYHSEHGHHLHQHFLLGFCGKVYSGTKVLDSHTLKILNVMYSHKDPGLAKYSFMERRRKKNKKEDVEELEKKAWADETHLDFFIQGKDSILLAQYQIGFNHNRFVRGEFELIRNPNLRELQFYKVMDAPTAFQELDMFISGVLTAPDNSTEVITDKIRIQQHGFDKCSFRKCGNC